MDITLTYGGIETRIIYEFNRQRNSTNLNHLAVTGVQRWARDKLACAHEFDLGILGGCWAADEHYI
jgi:hypothetical protein